MFVHNRSTRALLASIALGTGAACGVEPEIEIVVVDGVFDEWVDVAPALEDPLDADPESAADLRQIQVLDDPRYLYLTFDTERVITAQAFRGTIWIAIDADGDSTTGSLRHGLLGTDVEVALSRVPEGRRVGAGMAVYPITADGHSLPPILPGSLDIMAAPTHSASRFEVRVARARAVDGENTILLATDSARISMAVVDASGTRDTTDPFTHRFQTAAVYGPQIRWNQFLETRHGATRIVQWNVASERFQRTPLAFARVLAALDPDVVLLDEIYGDATQEDIAAFFGLPPFGDSGSPEGGEWEVVLGSNGGRQKSAVASRLPIRSEPSMLALEYTSDSLDALATAFPDSGVVRFLAEELERGLSAVGAWVTVDGREVLVAAVDFQSQGYDGSVEDRLREIQASVVRDAAAAATRDVGVPIVIGGDLNLVGSKRPLDRLVRGLDGGGDLEPAPALRFLDRSYATWRNETAMDFAPGRLDFVLVTPSSLDVDRAFVFDAEDVTDQLRESLGVQAEDNRVTSDHLPVVADIRFKPLPSPNR